MVKDSRYRGAALGTMEFSEMDFASKTIQIITENIMDAFPDMLYGEALRKALEQLQIEAPEMLQDYADRLRPR